MTDFAQRLLGRPALTGRVVGLDMARGLAILGMFTAHMWVSVQGPISSVMALSHGRSAPLFALLAGVSLGIMQDRLARRFAGSPALSRRYYSEKILVRAAVLILIAALLSLINTRILLILDNYGVWMVCVLLLSGLPVPGLLWVIGLLLVVGIPLWHYLNLLFLPSEIGVVLGLNDYQMPTFLIYVLTGLILWRLGWAGVTPAVASTAEGRGGPRARCGFRDFRGRHRHRFAASGTDFRGHSQSRHPVYRQPHPGPVLVSNPGLYRSAYRFCSGNRGKYSLVRGTDFPDIAGRTDF